MKLLASDDTALIEKAVELYRQRFGTVGLFENYVYDGIPEMLEALQQNGHTHYLATLKPTVYARRIIEHFELQRYFTGIFGSELDGTRSDKTSLLSYILQTASIAPPAAAMIGDREHDIIGAKQNGVAGFGVLWGYGTKNELERSGAQAAFKNPSELARHFRNSS
jgi:phosphoglycolate phosphatase